MTFLCRFRVLVLALMCALSGRVLSAAVERQCGRTEASSNDPQTFVIAKVLSQEALGTLRPAPQDDSNGTADEQPKANCQQHLLDRLSSKDSKTRIAALMELVKQGPRADFAVPNLVTILKQEDSYETTLALRCLSQIGPAAKDAVPLLQEILKSDDKASHFRFAAGNALSRIEPAGEVAIPTLIGILKDPGESQRTVPSGAREALGLIAPFFRKGEDGKVYLDSRDNVIAQAIGCLALFGPAAREAIPAIRQVQDDPETLPIIREIAAVALTRIHDAPPAVPGEQPAGAVNFRTRRAPTVIHILDAPALVRLLEPDDQQLTKLRTAVEQWQADYLKTAAELENLPAGDVRRRTSSPERDRTVDTIVNTILSPTQQQMLSRMTFLWNYTPVSFPKALRDEYAQPLKLTPEQQEALYHLNVRWVLSALEDFNDGEPESGRASRLQAQYQSIIDPAWEFKDARDATWRKILTEQQAERWQHIELQQAFRSDPLMVLKPYTRAWMHTLDLSRIPLVLVPYFDPPAAALQWTPEQAQQIRTMVADLDAEVPRIRAIADPAERRAAWKDLGTRSAHLREAIVELMTDAQRATWRTLAGSDSANQTDEPSRTSRE